MFKPLFKPASPLKVLEFEDGIAVFNSLTWDTHLLNDSAGAVLEFIISAPRTMDDVGSLLEELLDEHSRVDAAQHAETVLAELAQLRLITEEDT